MKKALVIGIILLFIGASVVSGFHANSTNNPLPLNRGWLYVGGTGEGNYTTIQSAIDASNSGDSIFVYSGIYYEGIVINKDNITLIGEDKYTTIIDGFGTANTLLISTCSNVFVNYFSIRNASGIHPDGNGVKIYSNGISNYNTISDCLIFGNNADGVLIYNEKYATSSYNNILNCEIYNNGRQGLGMDATDGPFTWFSNQIMYSKCYNNSGWGIETEGYMDGTHFVISDCEVHSNGAGGIYINSHYNVIMKTTSYQNDGDGICLTNADELIMVNCRVFENSGIGVNSSYDMQNGLIYHNDFINNNPNAVELFIENRWYSTSLEEGNYWSDYTGTDINGDGIGDTPYNISGGDNQDLYPFMEPNGWLNQPPVANFTAITDGFSAIFNATTSYDPDGNISTWLWNFGDGVEGAGKIVTHEYRTSGVYNVTLTVVDDDGAEDSITYDIRIQAFKKVIIFGRIFNLTTEGVTITFEAINTRIITFFPFSWNLYTSGEKITISQGYSGFVGYRYVLALCRMLI